MADIAERYRNGLLNLIGRCKQLLGELEEARMAHNLNTADPRTIADHLLRFDEGCSLRPYWCPEGWLTIGFGHNLGAWARPEDQGRVHLPSGDTITLDEAELILETDTEEALQAVKDLLGDGAVSALHPVRQAVLTCMAFQMGAGGLGGFRRTLRLIRSDEHAEASREMLESDWARQTPDRAERYARAYRTCELP